MLTYPLLARILGRQRLRISHRRAAGANRKWMPQRQTNVATGNVQGEAGSDVVEVKEGKVPEGDCFGF